MQGLELIVDGSSRTLSLEDLALLPTLDVMGDSGKGTRDAWSVRAIAGSIGEGARVTEVRGEGGRSVSIAADRWADDAQQPLLRLNRRGKLKFHWAEVSLEPVEGDELRNVEALVITTK